jgi:hypothetical protein
MFKIFGIKIYFIRNLSHLFKVSGSKFKEVKFKEYKSLDLSKDLKV